LLQISLRSMAFVSPLNGDLDDATRRGVLAWRKVNDWAHTGSPTPGMFRKVFNGEGTYKPRYEHPAKHVEGDLRHQVLVLVDDKKPVQIYTMSSGKPSTPTVQGKFRFYRQDPGANSEGMYYSSYFIRGYAVHGYPSVPATYPASHGCLRVPIPDAVRIYNWIDIGDTIYVFD
jgi:lipoprotein-anchoring transpeptidase ErfK/SrfK